MLLADEPTGNLDSRTSVEIMAIFQQLNERGITIIMVTHEQDIAAYAQRNVMMRDGLILQDHLVSKRTTQQHSFNIHRHQPFNDSTIQRLTKEMRIGPTFSVAYRALRRNKMRSVLTALGIIIGVGAVIAMVGIGNGAKAQVEAQIASLGENVILIFSGSTTSSGIRTGWGGAGTLKIEDAEAIRREVPGVIAVSEEVVSTDPGRALEIKTGSPGFTANQPIISTFANGRWPTARRSPRRMCAARTRFASLAARPRRRFTATQDPIGQILRIKNVPFHDYRRAHAERAEPARRRPGRHRDHALHQRDETRRSAAPPCATSMCRSVDERPGRSRAQQQIIALLRQRHNIRPGRDDDFTVRNQQEIAEAATATSEVMTVVARRNRRRLARRRRHRDHEHHARERDRADARDRRAHGGRRARPRHSHSVPDRSRDAELRWRRDRNYPAASALRKILSIYAHWPTLISIPLNRRGLLRSAPRSACSSGFIPHAKPPRSIRSKRCATNSRNPLTTDYTDNPDGDQTRTQRSQFFAQSALECGDLAPLSIRAMRNPWLNSWLEI